MALLVRKVADLDALNLLLRGGIIGGRDLRTPIYQLDGRTLVFSSPSATVTFDTNPEGAQQPLSLKDIVAQVNAVGALTGYASAHNGCLKIASPTGGTAVVLGAGGTANAVLGFDAGGATGVKYAAPGGSAPALVSAEALQQTSGGYLVVTNEA